MHINRHLPNHRVPWTLLLREPLDLQLPLPCYLLIIILIKYSIILWKFLTKLCIKLNWAKLELLSYTLAIISFLQLKYNLFRLHLFLLLLNNNRLITYRINRIFKILINNIQISLKNKEYYKELSDYKI